MKKEILFRELCQDPKLVFEGNKWAFRFNVFYGDGSVKEWKIMGKFDPDTDSNRIFEIEKHTLKRKGTFSYSMMD